ncbi:hypothetical protein ABZT47_11270 [Sphaerisporangium sp. NPDC005289]|uniref:hypothetical protein n=1 Tax=Sphaerisporangium sp. NPDC005289 TaxID=3155247 RepID=UPI0033B14A8E
MDPGRVPHNKKRPPRVRLMVAGGKPRTLRAALRTPPWRKALRAIHVITSVGLLGADAAALTLAIAGWWGAAPMTIYPAAHLIGSAVILPLALLSLVLGLALGLLTPWGVLRHWWVLGKLVLNTAGAVLAVFVLVPTLDAAAATALAGHAPADTFGLVENSGGATCVLVVITLLSVYKPFGRTPWSRPLPGR